MKKIVLLLFCLTAVVNLLFASGKSDCSLTIEEKSKNIALKDIEALVNQALDVFDVPGAAVGIVVDGKLIYARGFGYRDQEQKLPVTPDTLFAIGSCSKAFTTFVLGSLVDEGAIEWDDLVVKHLPDFRLSDDYITQNMTIRDLVTHRSGLPRHDFTWFNSSLSGKELFYRLKHLEFTSGLREKFHYNNLMYVVAGLVIEKVTGQTWENAVQQRVFDPLAMQHSNFSVDDSQNADNFAYPYEKRNDLIQKISFRNISNVGPAGSINSSIIDMSKWLQLQLSKGTFADKQLIQEKTLNEMHTIQFAHAQFPNERIYYLGYGLGWFIGNYRGHYLVEHDGGIDGFITNTSLFPQEKIGVVVLSNSSNGGSNLASCISKSIFDRLLGLEPIDWVGEISTMQKQAESAQMSDDCGEVHIETKPSHILDDYIGEYEHAGYGTVKIYLEDGQLVASYNRIITPLRHKYYDIFLGSKDTEDPVFADMHFSFQTSCSGDIDEIEIPFEMSCPITFKKRVASEWQDLEYLKQFIGSYGDGQLVASIQLRGNRLTLSLPGQPEYELEPEKKRYFAIKGLPGFNVRFIVDGGGQVAEVQSIQPNGIFSLKALR